MNRFTKSFADADTAFSGQYLKELEQLKELTDAELPVFYLIQLILIFMKN